MKGKKQEKRSGAAAVQMRSGGAHPYGLLRGDISLGGGDAAVYRAVREAVPVVDAAVLKLIRLTGGFTVSCGDEAAERGLREFVRTVPVGRGQRGLDAFLDSYLDSMITCGRAVGEIVVRGDRDIAAVICGNVADVQIREGRTPLDFCLCGFADDGSVRPFPRQDLLLFTPYEPEPDAPYGVSMLRGMPFLADILMNIYHSVGVNWERAGNVRYSVVYRPQGDGLDAGGAYERAREIAGEWASAMQASKRGEVRDFVSVGDVEIKVIGADGPVLDSEVPVRQILEQLVAKTGLPPFLLGLNWSSTERMSSQQADLMTSELTAIRRGLTPVLEKICRLWLRMHGYACVPEIRWDPINLQDDVEEARARLYDAQARQLLGEEQT
ncbi:MAG: serine/threonine protein phosphatase [Oscillospiraceae bacterium]|jgi:hypothetical protein|nr:serine/threonine protein phosphatase [Oscillospiraceae bacterium]